MGLRTLTVPQLLDVHARRERGEEWTAVGEAHGVSADAARAAYRRARDNGTLAEELARAAGPPREAPVRDVTQALRPTVQRLVVDDAPAPPAAALTSHSQSAHTIRLRARRTPQWEQWILLTADHHWDHPDCDRDLLAFHLDLAADRGAGVMVFGDLYCAMQTRHDRRGGKSAVRPEHMGTNYLDRLVDTGVEWYAPWASRLWLISDGNHESAVYRNLETDLTTRLCEGLRQRGSGVMRGSYRGFCTLLLDDGQHVQPIRLFWDHGSGGGGIVTKGVIQTNRRAAYVDADILDLARKGVSDEGVPYTTRQTHVCCSTYKAEGESGDGWHVETGKPPKPLGGWWLRLSWSTRLGRVQWQLMEVES